jgi:hypothetical protein
MQKFREWLREEEIKELNEMFEYTSKYTEVSKDDYIEYRKKIINKDDENAHKRGLDLILSHFREHGDEVKYYIYNDFLIFYGKFKASKKYEIHFWNIKTLSMESLGKGPGNFSSVFSAVMSIIKDKHIEEGKLSNVYVKHEDSAKVDFYQKIAIKMLDKLKVKWEATIDKDKKNKNVLVISKIKNKG